jgi:hypothetical protein
LVILFVIGNGLLLGGCSVAQVSESYPSTPSLAPVSTPIQTMTAIPALDLPEPAETLQVRTPEVTPPEIAISTPDPTSAPVPCGEETCFYPNQFRLARPIAPPGQDSIDPSYPYGSTQGGLRDPHHGVEFLNSFGTPVLAAYDGGVEVAGDDRLTFYGPYSYFYGNLVVLRHILPGVEEPVFTLYGHLSQVLVQVGQKVELGQEIGRVGMSGVATGSHLHFEVRFGENLYQRTRNPELWLEPHQDEAGEPNGGLAVRVLDEVGNPAQIESVVLQRLDGPEGSRLGESYPQPYDEKALAGQPPFQESFAAGDLAPGWYRVSFAYRGIQQRELQVLPGQLTVLTFQF